MLAVLITVCDVISVCGVFIELAVGFNYKRFLARAFIKCKVFCMCISSTIAVERALLESTRQNDHNTNNQSVFTLRNVIYLLIC